MHDPFGWTDKPGARPMILGHDGSHKDCGPCAFARSFTEHGAPRIEGFGDEIDLTKEWQREP